MKSWNYIKKIFRLVVAYFDYICCCSARSNETIVAISGFPRSGTSLLFNMLVGSLPGYLNEGRESSFRGALLRRGSWVTKLPNDIFNIRKYVWCNPYQKKIIHIVMQRDPRDIITSVHAKFPEHYYVGYSRRVFQGNGSGLGRIYEEMKTIQLKTVGSANIEFVKYEELIKNPAAFQKRLHQKYKINFRKDFSEYHLHQDALIYKRGDPRVFGAESNGVVLSSIGKWRNPKHFNRIKSEIKEHPEILSMVTGLGYEQDDAWFEEYKQLWKD